ncbi:uncharacterized protein LOC143143568 [Ptiloglossa arizonensis]|uniref:uncharacterized protein LOC143143568 n=1 Tax=Ptiloglossa arizonensis TaxID=3350558 RepID=UPI003F9FCCF4
MSSCRQSLRFTQHHVFTPSRILWHQDTMDVLKFVRNGVPGLAALTGNELLRHWSGAHKTSHKMRLLGRETRQIVWMSTVLGNHGLVEFYIPDVVNYTVYPRQGRQRHDPIGIKFLWLIIQTFL